MRNVVPVLLVALATLSAAADRKRNQAPPKPAEIEIVEITARRGDGRVSLDGRVKNTGERAAVGMVLYFDFMAPGRQVVTTKRGDLEIETLEPGEEAEFHVYAARGRGPRPGARRLRPRSEGHQARTLRHRVAPRKMRQPGMVHLFRGAPENRTLRPPFSSR
jgi:hypothetical protein